MVQAWIFENLDASSAQKAAIPIEFQFLVVLYIPVKMIFTRHDIDFEGNKIEHQNMSVFIGYLQNTSQIFGKYVKCLLIK